VRKHNLIAARPEPQGDSEPPPAPEEIPTLAEMRELFASHAPKAVPDLIERDRLWCLALIKAQEAPDDIRMVARVTRIFNELRPDKAAPPEGSADLNAVTGLNDFKILRVDGNYDGSGMPDSILIERGELVTRYVPEGMGDIRLNAAIDWLESFMKEHVNQAFIVKPIYSILRGSNREK